MRIRITFKFVGIRAQVPEDLDGVQLVAVDYIDGHRILSVLFQSPTFRLRFQEQARAWTLNRFRFEVQDFWFLLFKLWSSACAASFFGSAARARSNSPCARLCNPNCL